MELSLFNSVKFPVFIEYIELVFLVTVAGPQSCLHGKQAGKDAKSRLPDERGHFPPRSSPCRAGG